MVFLRSSNRTNKGAAASSKALWEVEVVSNTPTYGGTGRWDSFYRFKHLSTEKYLAAVPDDDTTFDATRHRLTSGASGTVYHLCLEEQRNAAHTVFELDSTHPQDGAERVPKGAYVRLSHVITKTWVHSMQVILDRVKDGKENKKPTMLKVRCVKLDRLARRRFCLSWEMQVCIWSVLVPRFPTSPSVGISNLPSSLLVRP